jgi:hypothetical protein
MVLQQLFHLFFILVYKQLHHSLVILNKLFDIIHFFKRKIMQAI